MRALYPTVAILGLALPSLLAQRILNTAPVPALAGRTTLAVTADASGNRYISSAESTSTGITFFTKLSPQGDTVYEKSFPCCIVGSANGALNSIFLAVDGQGNLIFASLTNGNAPVVKALQADPPADFDVQSIVGKLNTAGEPVFITYLGGAGTNQINAVALDAAGNIHVTGLTSAKDFPTTPGAYRTDSSNSATAYFAFVTKLSPAGDKLVYSTYLGKAKSTAGPCDNCLKTEVGRAIAIDPSGNAWIAGESNAADLPVTPDGLQNMDGNTGFLAELDPLGTSLLYLTRLPAALPTPLAVAIDSAGYAYVAGIGATATPGSVVKLRPGDSAVKFTAGLPGTPWTASISPNDDATIGGYLGSQGFVARVRADSTSAVSAHVFPPRIATRIGLAPSGDAALVSTDSWLTQYDATLAGIPSILGAGSSAIPGMTRNVSPGELFAVYGAALGPEATLGAALDAAGRVATSVGGIRVLFDGMPSPLIYAGPDQINAVSPFGLAGRSSVTMTIETPGGTASTTVNIVEAQPALYQGPKYAAAVNENGTYVSDENPAPLSSVVTFTGTGFGLLDTDVPDGTVILDTSTKPRWMIHANYTVKNGSPTDSDPELEVIYAGPAPGAVAGVYQVNVRMPDQFPSGGVLRMYLTAGSIKGPVVVVPLGTR